jgi:RNA polymerase subunit RPABC4/transcription elongation factor Spt4
MFGADQAINQLILFFITVGGIMTAVVWIGLVLWTWRDMRARSRDALGAIVAAGGVAVFNVAGIFVYLLLRPRETLAEQYERSLEEEALLQGIEEKPACPGCGRPANSRWQVCPYCHTRLKKPCTHCSEMLDLVWTVCPYCATVQPAPEGRTRGRKAAQAVEYIDDDTEA